MSVSILCKALPLSLSLSLSQSREPTPALTHPTVPWAALRLTRAPEASKPEPVVESVLDDWVKYVWSFNRPLHRHQPAGLDTSARHRIRMHHLYHFGEYSR